MEKRMRYWGKKAKNIGHLRAKVPQFCPQSADVCAQEVRCFKAKNGLFPGFSEWFFVGFATKMHGIVHMACKKAGRNCQFWMAKVRILTFFVC